MLVQGIGSQWAVSFQGKVFPGISVPYNSPRLQETSPRHLIHSYGFNHHPQLNSS